MLEGLATRFIIKQKQILIHIHIICLSFLSFFFRRFRETKVVICFHLDCVDVMCQIWFHLITKFYLKLMKFVCFLKCRTYEDERGVYDVSNSKNIEVMLVWPEII